MLDQGSGYGGLLYIIIIRYNTTHSELPLMMTMMSTMMSAEEAVADEEEFDI